MGVRSIGRGKLSRGGIPKSPSLRPIIRNHASRPDEKGKFL